MGRDYLFDGGDRGNGQADGGGGGDVSGGLGGLLASLESRAGRRTVRHEAVALHQDEEGDDRGAGGGDDRGAGGGDAVVAAGPGGKTVVEIADTVR